MTKPTRRVRAGCPPDTDELAGLPIQYWQPEPKPHPLRQWLKRVFSWSKK